MPKLVRGAAAVLLVLFAYGCEDGRPQRVRSTSPTAPSGNVSLEAPKVVEPYDPLQRIRLDGTFLLDSIGATSQVRATAIFTDGTTKDVTAETRWTTAAPSVVTISDTGLVTAVDFGVASIIGQYQTKISGSQFSITPPGTYIARGRVREPARSGLAGVQVVELLSGRTTMSDNDGGFAIAALHSPGRLRFLKDDYEQAADVDVTATTENVDTPLQRIIRLSPGQQVEPPPLAAHDVSYVIGPHRCNPCRRVRISVTQSGTVEVTARISYPYPQRVLILPSGEAVSSETEDLIGRIPVKQAGEVIVYLGLTGVELGPYDSFSHIKFTVRAEMR